MKKQFGELSQFLKRDVELFRSSDLNNTAIYFTNVEDEDRETAKAFFEVLKFELRGGDHQLYIRFPNTDYFVEMVDGGFGSGRGNMTKAIGENPWEDNKYDKPLTVYTFDKNLMIIFGREDWGREFEFMSKVASYDKGNPYNHPYPNETFFNYKEIEEALKLKFLKIPEDIRNIEYCYKTTEEVPTFFVVDHPKYNFKYDNHRFRSITGNKISEYQIKNFQRFRDGGTTIITVTDSLNIDHEFFSPTSLPKKVLCEKWDDIELVEASDEEKQIIIDMLNLKVIPNEMDKVQSIKYLISNSGENCAAQDLFFIIKDVIYNSNEDSFTKEYLNKCLKEKGCEK